VGFHLTNTHCHHCHATSVTFADLIHACLSAPGISQSSFLDWSDPLQMYVMPKHAWLLDCGQLVGLSSLPALR
jgi:hypothetical protein